MPSNKRIRLSNKTRGRLAQKKKVVIGAGVSCETACVKVIKRCKC